MLKVIIYGTYYKDNSKWYSSWNARNKKDCVYFEDYDDYTWYVIQHMDLSEIWRLKLNIFRKYHDKIKFEKFWEEDYEWNIFTWYYISSPIIEISNTEFASLLPSVKIRKNYFDWDNIKEKYFFKGSFINYVNLNV